MKDIYTKKEERKRRISIMLTVLVIAGVFAFLVFFPYDFQQLRGSLIEALRGGVEQESKTQYYYEYPEEIEFILERKLKVEALDSKIERYAIQAAYPEDIPGIQDVVGVKMSREPISIGDSSVTSLLQDDAARHFEFMQWNGSNFKGEDFITLTYHIKTKTHQWDITSENSGTVEDIPEELKAQYLKDQWPVQGETDFRIAPSSEKIKNLALEITKDESTVYDKTKAIYNFMIDNITYVISRSEDLPKSAFQTLKDREGDCDDQAILFISLCRAVGIPARIEAGVAYNPAKEEWGDHVWAQTYIGKNFADIDTVAKNFLFRDPFRFTDFVDLGSGEDLDLYYNTFSGTYFDSGTKPEFTQSYTALNFYQRGKIKKIAELD